MIEANPGCAMLEFLGGTRTVTGSRFLITLPNARVLVDCGLFQGEKALRERNWEPFPVDPASLDAVVLTHAHIDHSGYLPALVRRGFRGTVHATRGTAELCRIMLPDSGRIQEEDAEYANRKGFSKHAPALPLYTEEDAYAAVDRFQTAGFGQPVAVADGVGVVFRPAGHILGAATVHVTVSGPPERTIAFSGDLGRLSHPILFPPSPLDAADVLLVESTYGDRRHDDLALLDRLALGIGRVAARGGVVVIPAFAVDRTEIVLLHLRRLMASGRVPELPIYVDSPMALAALDVYRRAIREGWEEIRPELRGREAPFDGGQLQEVRDVEGSKELQERRGPFIVVSASGMATGGRVLHHLRARLPDPRNLVVLAGYQATRTRGRRILEGEPSVKMLGQYVPVKAEVLDLSGLSVHADAGEILTWLRLAKSPPEVAYVVHGELDASSGLAQRISTELGWNAVVPRLLERVRI